MGVLIALKGSAHDFLGGFAATISLQWHGTGSRLHWLELARQGSGLGIGLSTKGLETIHALYRVQTK